MGFKIYDYNGYDFPTNPPPLIGNFDGIITDFSETKILRNVIHDLPTADKDLIQKLGKKCRRFTIAGEIHSNSQYTANWFRNTILGYTGYLSGSDSRGYTILPKTEVLYTGLNLGNKAGRPFEIIFKLEAVEII